MKHSICRLDIDKLDLSVVRAFSIIIKEFGITSGELEEMLFDERDWELNGDCVFYVGVNDKYHQLHALDDIKEEK